MLARQCNAADVARLLRQAGAQAIGAEGCEALALRLNQIRDALTASLDDDGASEIWLWATAPQRALLKRLVQPDSLSIRDQRLTAVIESLDAAFPADLKPRPPPREPGYLAFAETLFKDYRAAGGDGTAHRNSPAMRFVASALTEAGWTATGNRPLTAETIAKAIRRHKRRKPLTLVEIEARLRQIGDMVRLELTRLEQESPREPRDRAASMAACHHYIDELAHTILGDKSEN